MVFTRRIATRLEPYFGYRSADRLVLSARALGSAPVGFAAQSRWRALRTMMAQFASREIAGLDVRLVVQGADGKAQDHVVQTNAEGFAHFDIELGAPWILPPHTQWERVELHWRNGAGEQAIEAHVLAMGTTTDLGIISDIDDTIIETGITGSFRQIARNWRRVLAHMPHERDTVAGAGPFYRALAGEAGEDVKAAFDRGGASPRRPIFYISSSPWNLFSYLVTFKQTNDLPIGPLVLRDWGLNRATLGSRSHGAHKSVALDTLLTMHQGIKFALIGDDTQGDLPAFAKAVDEHPGQIAAVILRQTGREALTAEEARASALIEAAGVPLWLGPDFTDGVEFLHRHGLAAEQASSPR